ncbi:hypothetical protein B5E48_09900 [Massilimicrobiota sp. An105]|uniref:PTS system mannose/fructose/N-acetylgalactosamine-transporter subunit IIB n=1 Tax=Massilimicrobiota sp. An105 TaxID=1965540 RepID=UPI000B380C1F|nr:PTS sugar transporter subunit IIB [Massilimicrobiota sp. An105]OUQ75989.1 hypothetical protein B5E48_09900 [Massilimicrobiota sp. An105]
MSLNLVRVDDRLIHGQVLLMWTKVRQGDAIILLVDDELANDPFLKEVFINAGNGLGKKVYIFTVEQAIEKVPKAISGKKKYYLISKKIEQLYLLKKKGVDFGKEIIFGTASKAEGTEKVYNNVYLSPNDMKYCEYLNAQGIDIQFKLIPDEKGLTFKEVQSNYKGG